MISKNTPKITVTLLFSLCMLACNLKKRAIQLPKTDMDYFQNMTNEVAKYRKKRLINFKDFMEMSEDPETIILDARSKEMYDKLHIKGAIHLNYSDFDANKLAELLVDNFYFEKDTNKRILIYCNNNFSQENFYFNDPFIGKHWEPQKKKMMPQEFTTSSIENKKYSLALNFPVFITLYAYGYKNIYQLNELIEINTPMLKLEGNDLTMLKNELTNNGKKFSF